MNLSLVPRIAVLSTLAEGGHGAAADNKQSAFMHALAYTFLWDHLSMQATK